MAEAILDTTTSPAELNATPVFEATPVFPVQKKEEVIPSVAQGDLGTYAPKGEGVETTGSPLVAVAEERVQPASAPGATSGDPKNITGIKHPSEILAASLKKQVELLSGQIVDLTGKLKKAETLAQESALKATIEAQSQLEQLRLLLATKDDMIVAYQAGKEKFELKIQELTAKVDLLEKTIEEADKLINNQSNPRFLETAHIEDASGSIKEVEGKDVEKKALYDERGLALLAEMLYTRASSLQWSKEQLHGLYFKHLRIAEDSVTDPNNETFSAKIQDEANEAIKRSMESSTATIKAQDVPPEAQAIQTVEKADPSPQEEILSEKTTSTQAGNLSPASTSQEMTLNKSADVVSVATGAGEVEESKAITEQEGPSSLPPVIGNTDKSEKLETAPPTTEVDTPKIEGGVIEPEKTPEVKVTALGNLETMYKILKSAGIETKAQTFQSLETSLKTPFGYGSINIDTTGLSDAMRIYLATGRIG